MEKKNKNKSKPISYKTIRMNTTLDGYIANDKPEPKDESQELKPQNSKKNFGSRKSSDFLGEE